MQNYVTIHSAWFPTLLYNFSAVSNMGLHGKVMDNGNILFESYANQHSDVLDDKTNETETLDTDITTPTHFLHKTMGHTV
jgi:hypothetical protein